jgi:hypothetical protein
MAQRDSWTKLGAEFLVIVVGVLVALAVDQWRDDRSDRVLGDFYLSALERDLRSDSSLLATDLGRARSTLHSLALLDSLVGGLRTPPDAETLNVALDRLTSVIDPPIATGTLQDLMSSGNSRLIEDPDVRGALLGYSTYTERARTWLAELREVGGPGSYPTSLLRSPFRTFMLRGPVAPGGSRPDARSAPDPILTLDALVRDSTQVREWLSRKEESMVSTAELLDLILRGFNLPLLESVRAARSGEATASN